jgi:dTDP-4-dehydrorhamnose 3,5-epimerase
LNIIEKKISGVFEISFLTIIDDRGYNLRTYDDKVFEYFGIRRNWVQESQTRLDKRGIIRGLHFQFPPYGESKLVRCIRGSVQDVFADLRKDSPTFGRWESVELNDYNKRMLFLPRGIANGYCSLSEGAEVINKVDNYYSKDHESGIIWNDNRLNIRWSAENPSVSEKDSKLLTLDEFVSQYKFIEEEYK